MTTRSQLSPALQAAQELLYKKRAEARAERVRLGLPVDLGKQQSQNSSLSSANRVTLETVMKQLPEHLGWGSEGGTKAIRAALASRQRDTSKPSLRNVMREAVIECGVESHTQLQPLEGVKSQSQAGNLTDQTIKVYPALAVAMLRDGYAPQARVYYLLRHLDEVGRGWLSLEEVRDYLTGEESLLRIANRVTSSTNAWRNLRGILNKGEGIFWQRDREERLWLRGAARIAVSLGCGQLNGYPVALPVSCLLGRIKQVKAHLYATFHTGREKDLTKEGPAHKPISQFRLREITGIPESTQRRYNKVAKVRIYRHYATGRKYEEDQFKDAVYDRWGNAFKFTDYKGKQGGKGITYIAQRLPNSYSTKTLQTSKGRQEKINKHIDLVTNVGEEGAQAAEIQAVCASSSLTHPMRGNGADVDRLFYHDGKQARKAQKRQPKLDHFQQSQVRIQRGGRIWYLHSKEQQ